MAVDEQLELKHYPAWEPQDGEPPEKYLIFERFFLASPKASLLGAYRRYRTDKGENGQVNDTPGSWRDDCAKFQWRERHQSFWRWKNQNDAEWRQEQIRLYQSESLDMAGILRFRAQEILENFRMEDASPKDACQMLRLAGELTENALNLGDLDKAYAKLLSAGYEVTGGGIGEETATVAVSSGIS